MRRSFLLAGLFALLCNSANFAQQAGRTGPRGSDADSRANVDPALWRVLQDWSAGSSGIKRLKGRILQRTYDFTFSVERLGTGDFYYEAPDKGRLDINPIEITQALLNAREEEGAQVRRDKNGKPFKLQSEDEQRWICDGQRVTSMEVAERTATVLKLPPGERGRNIMNGPLPFLFALPPEQAVRRFDLKLLKAPTRADSIATLEATPRLAKDAQAWKGAKVMLDTRTGLPLHVQLIKPSGNSTVIYSFSDLTVNSRLAPVIAIFGKTPFNPGIPKGWKVRMVAGEDSEPGGQRVTQSDTRPRLGPVVPNLVGMSHEDAEAELIRLGVSKKNISKFRGDPAIRAVDVFKVRQQKPLPGTPIDKDTRVSLQLWTKTNRG